MSHYNVNALDVENASQQAMSCAESVRAEVNAMMGHLNALEGSWQGSAATAFSGLIQDWKRAQLQVEESLDSISTALSQAAVNYREAEEAATRMFSH